MAKFSRVNANEIPSVIYGAGVVLLAQEPQF